MPNFANKNTLSNLISLFCKKYKSMSNTEGYSGLAIADYFVKKCLDNNIPVTNMSILKMIYFAHGLAYPTLHRKLIKDPFYAWGWGPVEKNTYDCFKRYVANPIRRISGETDKELKSIESDNELTKFLDSLLPLAKVNPFRLSEKSHEPGAPWDVTTPYDIIDDKVIQVYFNARYGKKGD